MKINFFSNAKSGEISFPSYLEIWFSMKSTMPYNYLTDPELM
jgi:hypothetical protein